MKVDGEPLLLFMIAAGRRTSDAIVMARTTAIQYFASY